MTTDQICKIYQMSQQGIGYNQIAQEFNISKSTINGTLRRVEGLLNNKRKTNHLSYLAAIRQIRGQVKAKSHEVGDVLVNDIHTGINSLGTAVVKYVDFVSQENRKLKAENKELREKINSLEENKPLNRIDALKSNLQS